MGIGGVGFVLCLMSTEIEAGCGGEVIHVEILTVIVHRLKEQFPKIKCA
jgi:hypothetical protein